MKLHALRRVAAALCLLALPALAQVPVGYVQVTGSTLTDSTGTPVANATIAFAPVNNSGQAIGYQVNGKGQAITSPVTTLVTAGAFSIRLADTSLTLPVNVCFSVMVTDNTSGKSYLGPGYNCFQPAGYGPSVTSGMCTAASGTAGGTWEFDKFQPNLPGLVVQQVGPAGPTGPTGPQGAPGTPGGSLSYPGVTSDGSNGLNVIGTVAAGAGVNIKLSPLIEELSNNPASGVTLNKLVCMNGSAQAQTCTTASTSWTGLAVGGATGGTAGVTRIARSGQAGCIFDGLTAIGHYVSISSTSAGDCHDSGAATYPTSGAVLGKVMTVNGGAETVATVNLYSPGIMSSGSASVIGSNPITPVGAPQTVPNIIGHIQALHPSALRSTMNKAALIGLNNTGNATYPNPAQIYIVEGGDSTTGFHANAVVCTLGVQYGVAGYIGGSPQGTAIQQGYGCPGGYSFNPVFTGGAAGIVGDWGHFPGGNGVSIPAGGTATSQAGFSSTRQMVFYTADVSGVTVTVSTSTDNVTYTPLAGCNGIAVTQSVGGVCDQTITKGAYYLRVSASGGTLLVWTAGQVDTTVNGTVPSLIGVGGTSLPDQASVPTALRNPWYAAIHPDLVTFEMKANGVKDASCNQATTAIPAVLQNRDYWWTRYIAPFQTANPLVDVLYFGSYSTSDTDICIPIWNQYSQAWAYGQNPEQTYVDNYWQLTNSQMISLGWATAGDVHENQIGQVAQSNLDIAYLGLLGNPGAAVGQAINNFTVNTMQLNMKTLGLLDFNLSFPYYWRFHATRGIELYDNNNILFGRLCTTAAGSPCTTVDKSFLPPFQVSSLTSNEWISLSAAGVAGVYTTAAATASALWASSNIGYGVSTGSGTIANPSFDVSQHFLHDSPTVNVTSQVYTNSGPSPPDNVFWITQPATPVTWAWSSSGNFPKSMFRVPQMASVNCFQEVHGWSGQGYQIPMAGAVCTVGSFIGQGDNKQMLVADGVLTGTATNVDAAGELSFSSATTASYNFETAGYTVHPECVAEPQFDPGAGVYHWITYSGTAQTQMALTIHFSSAVTGAVTYKCTPRT